MIKDIILLAIGLSRSFAYKLCIPVMFLLIACKLWYEPYTWNWAKTIIVPLGCGICGMFITL